jgi:hypothetical protein
MAFDGLGPQLGDARKVTPPRRLEPFKVEDTYRFPRIPGQSGIPQFQENSHINARHVRALPVNPRHGVACRRQDLCEETHVYGQANTVIPAD